MSDSQFSLLKQRRFLPFFITQALGAANDNIFKNVLVMLLTYQVASELGESASTLVNMAAILFILPFFLISATAGQLAEKYEKSNSMQWLKISEIGIMLIASIGFYFEQFYFLLFVLFLMGFQSALFGPLKFGFLPQHLKTEELVGGNALVETGTFLAILLGTIAGSLLGKTSLDLTWITISVILSMSVAGYLASRKIPHTPAVAPDLKINWNIFTESYKNIRFIRKDKPVFLAVLGISWFWFYGATYLVQIPEYAKSTLAGDETVATLLLAAFCIGIGIGSILCEKLSSGRIEVGLVPIGAFGLSYFAYDLFTANQASQLVPVHDYLSFLDSENAIQILFDCAMIGACGGLFTVPLYSLVQKIGDKQHMSRTFAGLNIINAFFMVLSGAFAMFVLSSGYSIPELFMITSIINALVAVYIFTKAPLYIFRLITWFLVNTIYRIRRHNLSIIPKEGAGVIVANHVSFVDALIIAGYCKRNLSFVMYHKIFHIPFIGWFFKLANAIPIAPAHEDKQMMQQAFDKIAHQLEMGNMVCIFPEGKLTSDGQLGEFKKGIEKIIKRTPVPVYPLALNGLWGSWFSRFNGKAMRGLPRKFMAKISITAAQPIPPQEVTAERLQLEVKKLLKTP
ncbi:MFS transporter [Aliikangiella sp. IMCC44653]